MDQVIATVEPAAPVDHIATVEPAAPVDQVIATVEPAAPVDQVIATIEPAAPVDHIATIEPATLSDAIQAAVSDLRPEVTSTGEPAAPVIYAALPGDVTANALEPSGPMQAFDHQAQHDLEAGMSDGSTLGIVGIDVHHTATALA